MTTTPLEQLERDTDSLEPGDLKPGTYIRRPGAETEANPDGLPGTIISDLDSAGYSYLYDTVSRERSVVNNNMKAAQLKVARLDGSLVFTAAKPSQGPWRGIIKCFLHTDQPDRPKYNAMGFSVCSKSNLPNQYQADNHARNRHRDEWRAVEADRERREREEDRRVQQAVFSSVGTRGEGTPVVQRSAVAPVIGSVRSGQCSQCDWSSDAKRSQNRKVSLKQHVARVHA